MKSFGSIKTYTAILVIVLLCKCEFAQASSILFKWPEGKKMGLSLTFNDARLSQIDKGIPLLDKYGVKGTFYVSPDLMAQRMSGWKKAFKNGHDIGNHSMVHPCTGNFDWARERALENYTLPDMKKELVSANKLIKDSLGVNAVSFAYPCGQKFVGKGLDTKSYVPVVASLFVTGRGWRDEGANDPLFCDLSQLNGMELDGKSFEDIKKLIDVAKSKGQWLVLAGHETDNNGTQTTLLSTLEAICRYATDPANEIWIDHVQNIASYIKEQRGEISSVKLPIYKNPSYPVSERVEDLLSRMTLEEKIGQMNMPCMYISEIGKEISEKTESSKKLTAGTFMEKLGPIGGFFTLANNILKEGAHQQATFFNELQKIALEKTRLGIPLLQTEEGTHGVMCSGTTIFPEGLALGSTWNLELIKNIYEVTAKEARSLGIHQLYTLVVEPVRDPRLGRNEEGYSEDPYFCARMAETIVHAVQGNDISANDKTVAGLCHFPGQSEPVSGMERGAMEISERKLREVFLKPWVAGIKKAGALGVMATYPSVDGIPTHTSEFLLTNILRNELGFDGLVLSEGSGITTIVYEQLAGSQKEAGAIALKAGVDVGISFEEAFLQPMLENVKKGKVSMELVDRAVRRILRLKFQLGLFEQPYVKPDDAVQTIHTKESQELALQAAREGIVLLKNARLPGQENNLLPLKKDIKKIAVIGPNADNRLNQLGDYTSNVVLQEVTTVLKGVKEKVSGETKVEYVMGCKVIGNSVNEITKAAEAAKRADLAIVVLGENEWLAPNKEGTSGEGYDVANLDLTGLQEDLLKSVYQTGTPVVLVLINGRALSIRWAAEHIPAIVEAWIPGEKGGTAIADVLWGDYNPSGKLPVTFPRHSGQLPVYYNYMPSKQEWIDNHWGAAYADMPATPLWEFGFGLSYTQYEYSNLLITPSATGPYGEIKVSFEVKNTGKVKGSEIVQLYIRDEISSVIRPVKELKGFEKVSLEPGEKKTVEFILNHELLGFYNRHLEFVVEPGVFNVMVGSSSEDIRLKGQFEVTE